MKTYTSLLKELNTFAVFSIESFYETELVLTFEEGVLIDQKEYDNSKSYKSVFTENQDSLQNFIYYSIDVNRQTKVDFLS